jgi:hypothetical protein
MLKRTNEVNVPLGPYGKKEQIFSYKNTPRVTMVVNLDANCDSRVFIFIWLRKSALSFFNP